MKDLFNIMKLIMSDKLEDKLKAKQLMTEMKDKKNEIEKINKSLKVIKKKLNNIK